MPERIIRAVPAPDGIPVRRVENDVWRTLGVKPDEDLATLPPGPVIVPLALWKERGAQILERGEPLGVWLKPDDDPADIAADLDKFSVVAVHFPKFTDGRGYSTGALLRTRYGYRGELRAFGDVGRDQLFYLARCGFDAFRLADHRDPESALASFSDFTVRYQGSVDDPVPLYRKRAVAGERP
jgi:uncharacterized protein (DUF934 family)